MLESSNRLRHIGSTEYISVAGIAKVPAKIDTGADSSSIWASQINMDLDGTLSFVLFDHTSPLYTGKKIRTRRYSVRTVRSSHGDTQIRYRVTLEVVIRGDKFITKFTLADRSRNQFPVLIGRRTLEGRFLVDVSKSSITRTCIKPNLIHELKNDPYNFHRKYIDNGVTQ